MIPWRKRRAAPALLLAMTVAAGCGDGEGEVEGASGDAPRVETEGAGTLDGDDVLDANITVDTQTVPLPDSIPGR